METANIAVTVMRQKPHLSHFGNLNRAQSSFLLHVRCYDRR